MGKRLVFEKPRTVGFEEYSERAINENEVRLETLFSGISRGTELTVYRGENPYLNKKWDAEKRIFIESEKPTITYPTESGYEAVGRVVEVGKEVAGIEVGDIVYGGEWFRWTHKTTHILSGEAAKRQKMPKGIDPRAGVFMALIQTAFTGVLDTRVNIGEQVVLFGAGIVGQLILQLLKLNGAYVVVVDLEEKRLKMASEMGADVVLNPSKFDIAG